MMRTALILAAVAAVLFVAASWIRRELAIDRCLDHGGRWNAARATCEGTHSVANGLVIIAPFQARHSSRG